MLACVAEDFDEEIGRAVDHPGLPREPGRTVDPSHELHDAAYSIQRANLGTQHRQQGQRARAGRLVSGLLGELSADFTCDCRLAVDDGALACEEDQVAGAHRRHVRGNGLRSRGEFDPQRLEPSLRGSRALGRRGRRHRSQQTQPDKRESPVPSFTHFESSSVTETDLRWPTCVPRAGSGGMVACGEPFCISPREQAAADAQNTSRRAATSRTPNPRPGSHFAS